MINTVATGSCGVSELTDIIMQEAHDNLIVEPDKNTITCKMLVSNGFNRFDIDKSTATLLENKKRRYHVAKNTASGIVAIVVFCTISNHCSFISGVKYNAKVSDNLYTFDLPEPPSYTTAKAPNNVLYQNVKKYKIE